MRSVRKWGFCIAGLLLVSTGVVLGCRQYSYFSTKKAADDITQEKIVEAQGRLKTAVRLWPWNVDAQFWSARAARISEDMQLAETHLTRCLAMEGGATERIQLEFLLMRVQSGEIDDVAPTLFALVEREGGHPDSLAILRTIGRAYSQRLRFRPAYACMSKWIEVYPEDPIPYQYRGWCLERLGNSKLALADYQKALELNPELIEARLRVVEIHLEDKQAPEAMPHVEWLFARFPQDDRVRARMGMCQFLMGKGSSARELMESAEPHLTDDAALLVALANLDLQDNRPLDAERRLRHVLKLDSSDTEAMFVLANALQILGKTAESEQMRSECLRKRVIVDRIHELLKSSADTPNSGSDVCCEIGDLFLQIDREKFGIYWTEQALERDSSNQRAHRILAAYYDKKGDKETADLHRRQLRNP